MEWTNVTTYLLYCIFYVILVNTHSKKVSDKSSTSVFSKFPRRFNDNRVFVLQQYTIFSMKNVKATHLVMKFRLKNERMQGWEQFLVKNALVWNVTFREDGGNMFLRKVINYWQAT